MPNLSLLIEPRLRVVNESGVPYAGAKLYAYAAGTSTPQNTYSDAAETTPNANPIVADAGGLFGPVYLSALAYKFILKTSADVTVWTQDNVWGENFALLFDDTFILRNAADQTKRFRFSAASITAGQTRVITIPDVSDTMVNLSSVQSLANKTLSAVGGIAMSGRSQWKQGADVVSAADMTLGSDGNVFRITGTTTINRILVTGWQAGSIIVLQFTASLTVAHNVASGAPLYRLMLAGAVNFSATVNDMLTLVYMNSDGWFEIGRAVI